MTDLTEVESALDESKFVTFPDSPFRLYQPFEPAGDQPVAIEQLVEGVRDGLWFQTLLGVTGSGKTFTMANVIARLGRPAIVFAPNKTLAAQLYSEFRDFFPQNAVEYFVSYYDYYQPEAYVPQRDLFIEKDSAINEHIEQMRLSCTKSLMERRDVVIVATVSAIYGIGNPNEYHQMILTLRAKDRVSQRDIIARLIQMQYTRNDIDFDRGTFRVRGDTIDIFPAEHAELAVRVDLFDDEIDSIQLFDPLTGRVRQKIPRFTVYPGSHYVTPRSTVLRAIETIKEELRERLEFFRKENKLVEEQRLEQRTRFDLEMMAEIGFTKGIENYHGIYRVQSRVNHHRRWSIICPKIHSCFWMSRMCLPGSSTVCITVTVPVRPIWWITVFVCRLRWTIGRYALMSLNQRCGRLFSCRRHRLIMKRCTQAKW